MKCIYCKNKISNESNFCNYCGKPISVDAIAKINIQRILQNAKNMGTDLLEVSAHECSCKYCAQFQGKVLSITGKNKNYPRLPKEVLENGNFHKNCRHSFFPYFNGSNLVYSKKELDKINKTAK